MKHQEKKIAAVTEIVSCISVRGCGRIRERFNQTQGMAFVGCTGSLNYFIRLFCSHRAKATIFHFKTNNKKIFLEKL